MKKILEIPKPKSNSFIVWEHLMKSIVVFVGTFILLFFGILMLGSRNGNNRSENNIAVDLLMFLFENPVVYFGLTIVAVLIANLYTFRKNKAVKFIVKIEYNDKEILFHLTNLYYSKIKEITIPFQNFEFYIENSVTNDNEKRQKIVFLNSLQNKIVGEINPKHFFWSEHLVQLKNVMLELENYKTESKKVIDKKPGLSTFTNWR